MSSLKLTTSAVYDVEARRLRTTSPTGIVKTYECVDRLESHDGRCSIVADGSIVIYSTELPTSVTVEQRGPDSVAVLGSKPK